MFDFFQRSFEGQAQEERADQAETRVGIVRNFESGQQHEDQRRTDRRNGRRKRQFFRRLSSNKTKLQKVRKLQKTLI